MIFPREMVFWFGMVPGNRVMKHTTSLGICFVDHMFRVPKSSKCRVQMFDLIIKSFRTANPKSPEIETSEDP